MAGDAPRPRVVAASRSAQRGLSKEPQPQIELIAGLGVDGDIHAGARVRHRSRARKNPDQPNLRQVHLLPVELHEELRAAGYPVEAGTMGENVLTADLDLIALPTGTALHLGADAVVELTGLRNPCVQLERFSTGLMRAVLGRDEHGGVVRRAGVLAVVRTGGVVHSGDHIRVIPPTGPHVSLPPV